MSYATSLLMAYPPPYGPSTLLSDDLVQRSSLGAYYEPSVPYTSSSRRLLSDELAYGPSSYRSATYPYLSSTTYPTPSFPNWQRDLPAQTSYASINHVREYTDSLGTASNVNTASSMAHSIDENHFNGPTSNFPNYQSSYNRLLTGADRNSHITTIWSPSRSKLPHTDEKPTSTHRSLPERSATTTVQKESPTEESKHEKTSVPSSPPVFTKQESNLQRNPTPVNNEEQRSSVDIHAWLTETKNDTSNEEKPVEQAWTDKIDHLHTTQAQREKEKAKGLPALPSVTKKSAINNNRFRRPSYTNPTGSYFDSLFDGNYYRKSSNNQQIISSSYQHNNSSNKPKTTIFSKNISPRKVPQYEPPSITRPRPTITTTSWKNQEVKQDQHVSTTPRETIHKDSDERFREALQKIRSDRAEQQQKDTNESTAKRLNYGNYVRRSTKEGSLQNIIKPSPWTDFFEMKKGNVYSLTKEEKRDRFNQLRSYAERVRNRNFALHHEEETARSQRRSLLFPLPNHKSHSDDDEETFHKPVKEAENDAKSLKRSDSSSSVKTTTQTYTKQIRPGDMSSRTSKLTDQSSSTTRRSDDNDGDISDFDSKRRKKKSLYDSSVRSTSATEDSENDETSEQPSARMKHRDTDDDLFTVREEKTQESLEGARYKKR